MMSSNPLIRSIAAILHPTPQPADPDDQATTDLVADDIEEQRHAYAANLERATDATDDDPLLMALDETAGTITRAETDRRHLLAYAREVLPGRGYSLAALAERAGMTPSGVRTAYKQADVDAVNRALSNQPADDPDAETAAIQQLTRFLDGHMRNDRGGLIDPDTAQATALADPDTQLRPRLSGVDLDDAAWHRVVEYLRHRYADRTAQQLVFAVLQSKDTATEREIVPLREGLRKLEERDHDGTAKPRVIANAIVALAERLTTNPEPNKDARTATAIDACRDVLSHATQEATS